MRRSQQQQRAAQSQNSTISQLFLQLNKSLGAGSLSTPVVSLMLDDKNSNTNQITIDNNLKNDNNNQSGQLLRNIKATTTNKFNLKKFWQRNSSNSEQNSIDLKTANHTIKSNTTTTTTTITNDSNLPQQFQSIDLNSATD